MNKNASSSGNARDGKERLECWETAINKCQFWERPSCRIRRLSGKQGIAFSDRGNSTNLLVCCYPLSFLRETISLCRKGSKFIIRKRHEGSQRRALNFYRFSGKPAFR